MPIDTNIYMDFIKNRMTPEQAKMLAKKMDGMQEDRMITGLLFIFILVIVLAMTCC